MVDRHEERDTQVTHVRTYLTLSLSNAADPQLVICSQLPVLIFCAVVFELVPQL